MQRVINLLIMLHLGVFAVGQAKSDKLRKEQKIIEKKISQTKTLLNKVKSNAKNSFAELKLLDNQIKNREELVKIYDGQVRIAEIKVLEKENEMKRLQNRLAKLKTQYKKMIFFAYKNRNKVGKLMFLLSSSSYNEAQKRHLYLKKVAGLQRKQVSLIKLHHGLITTEIENIKDEKTDKETALNEKKGECEKIAHDKSLKEDNYKNFKAEEEKLFALLKDNERKKEELKNKINAAIRSEIAASQEIERKKEEARKKEITNKKEAVDKTPKKNTEKNPVNEEEFEIPKTVKSDAPISSEGNVIGKNFESNKGRLPSPVSNGSITEKFGKNAHPTLAGVYTNNNGIDITCAGNSTARSVFEGVVSAVINVNGAGKVVIIKHGNYRSVYSNLQNTYVKVGDKISSKQNLGIVMLEDETFSILHFEIHLIVGSGTQSLNPSLWINR